MREKRCRASDDGIKIRQFGKSALGDVTKGAWLSDHTPSESLTLPSESSSFLPPSKPHGRRGQAVNGFIATG